MALFGLFGRGKKNRSHNLKERLEEVELQSRLEGLQDRRNARELRIAAINHPNPSVLLQAADGLYRPRGSRTSVPLIPQATETRETKIIDTLLARALMDPDEKLDELRERALKRRRLMRDLDDDDEDEDEGPMGNLKQMLPLAMVALVAAPMLRDPTVMQNLGPILERFMPKPPEAPPAPIAEPQPVYQVQPVEPAPTPPPPSVAVRTALPPETEGAPDHDMSEGAHVTVHPSMVLNALRTMEPPAFAAWILGQPGGFGFVEQLAEIPEDNLAATLNQYASLPRIGPLAQWGDVIAFLAANPEHAAAVMSNVRRAYLEESQAI